MKQDPAKWAELAAQVQATVLAEDAADPDRPMSVHEAKRAVLNIRRDMVMVTAMLAFLNNQTEAVDHKARTVVRLLWSITAILAVIAIRREMGL